MSNEVKNVGNEKFFSLIQGDSEVTVVFYAPLTIQYGAGYDYIFKMPNISREIVKLRLDFFAIEKYDSFLIVFLNNIKKKCDETGIHLELTGITDDMDKFIKKFGYYSLHPDVTQIAENRAKEYITLIGENAILFIKELRQLIEFYGELCLKLTSIFYNPSAIRWKDFPFHFMRAGVNGLLICLLILFIIGVISGYQGAMQLRQFGADKYIADLIGISITRELGPLMVAILVAGRSGSAFAAEIGTMKVSDEIDALRAMGFDYMKFLVLPRVIAVTLAMPILTILSDISGITGGLIASLSTLDITTAAYMNELQSSLGFDDIGSGLLKSLAFGFLVASVGCFQGLQVTGGAESVGKYTTRSVVSGILMIIFSDALFTFLFDSLGI